MVNHVAWQCVERPVRDNFADSRWAERKAAGVAAQTVPLEDDRVLMLHPAEQPVIYTPFTVTCGAKQFHTSLEPTTFDPQARTLISILLNAGCRAVTSPRVNLAKIVDGSSSWVPQD